MLSARACRDWQPARGDHPTTSLHAWKRSTLRWPSLTTHTPLRCRRWPHRAKESRWQEDPTEQPRGTRRFTREQLEAELAKVEKAYSERFAAELAKFEESERMRLEQERRLGNE